MTVCQRPECQTTSGCAHRAFVNGVHMHCVWLATPPQDASDIAAARRALADFEKNGGTTLEELKRELGIAKR